jgi:hypothetical protein
MKSDTCRVEMFPVGCTLLPNVFKLCLVKRKEKKGKQMYAFLLKESPRAMYSGVTGVA